MFTRRGFVMTSSALTVTAGRVLADDVEKAFRGVFRGAAKRFVQPAQRPPENTARTTGVQRRGYMTKTSDGWKLVAQRYWSPERWDKRKMPVVLCHGFSYNAHFFDLNSNVSLAGYLAQAGFDCWAVNLRGCGQSNKWAFGVSGGADALVGRAFDRISGQEIPQAGFVSIDPKFYHWNLDDHVEKDVPALLSLVKQHTGAPQIAWLGHSMGGNIMLAHLARNGQDPSIGKLVTVGSQVTMPDGQLLIQFLLEMLQQREMSFGGRQPTPDEIASNMNNVFFNQYNTDPAIMHALTTYGHDMPSVGLIKQYMDLSKSGVLRNASGKYRYCDGINQIQCPYLIASGSVDQIAPPGVQRHLHERVGSTNKRLWIIGRSGGQSVDCGHNDSLVGRTSRQEVFPTLARWLAA